jgi:hypothetical protein
LSTEMKRRPSESVTTRRSDVASGTGTNASVVKTTSGKPVNQARSIHRVHSPPEQE